MLLGTRKAQLSPRSLSTPHPGFGNHRWQVLTACYLSQEVGCASHTHVPFNPLGNPRAGTIVIVISQITKESTEVK